MNAKRKVTKVILYVLLVALAIAMLVPFYWMVISSLKLNKDVFSIPMRWWPELQCNMEETAAGDLFYKYGEADYHHHHRPAVHQLFCGLWVYKVQVCGQGYNLFDVRDDYRGSVAGVYGSPVYPGFQDGAQ